MVAILRPHLRLALLAFLTAVAFVFASTALLTGDPSAAFSKGGHMLMTAVTLAGFLYIFRRDRKNLLATGALYLLLLTPALLLASVASGEVYGPEALARAVAASNRWAISISVLVMVFTASSCFFASGALRTLIRALSALLWLLAMGLPLTFIVYWLTHRTVLSPDILVAIYQTNPDEALEFLSVLGRGGLSVLFASVVVASAVVLRTLMRRQSLKTANRAVAAMAALVLVVSLVGAAKAQRNLVLNVFQTAAETVKGLDAFKENEAERRKRIEALPNLAKEGRKGLFVVVIGESQTRDRMSAYGYGRDTTPWLRSRRTDGNFVFFEKAYSSYVQTVPALSQALTAKNQYSLRSLAESPSIVEMTRAAGFESWWLSNQHRSGIWEPPTTAVADQTDRRVWLNRMTFAEGASTVYDDALLDEVKRIPVEPDAKRVVFLHVLGAHRDYTERYPATAAKWPSENVPDAYDNALLFNDGVMRRIYEDLRNRPDFQALVYVSDHGEDVALGHTPDNFTWPMARIPFWVAVSERFRSEHPENFRAMRANAPKPWTNDMLFDTLCGLLGVTGHPYYEPKHDVASKRYARKTEELTTLFGKKRITEDPNLRR